MSDKNADELRQDIKKLDIEGVTKHIIYSLIAIIFLGSFYYFFKWKIIGVFLLFFIGYALIGIILACVVFWLKIWGIKKINKKEKEKQEKNKSNELDF